MIVRSLFLMLMPFGAHAILPTAEITVRPKGKGADPYTLLASQASFGPRSPIAGNGGGGGGGSGNNDDTFQKLVLVPESNPLMCDNITASMPTFPENSIAVVPRGECTYQRKTWLAQQLGASGVILYNTLSSRYSINTTTHEDEKYPTYSTRDIIFPQDKFDYDCDKGSALIPTIDLSLKPLPYNRFHNDPILTGNTNENLCLLHSRDNLRNCASKRCLIAEGYSENSTTTQVCCAWDLHLWLYRDSAMPQVADSIEISAVFVTMEQGDILVESILKGGASASLNSRWRPHYNPSSMLIWALGVLVAAVAAYWSATDYHKAMAKLLKRWSSPTTIPSGNASSQQRPQALAQRSPIQEETLELEPIHALGFIVMASSSLFILFYFKIYNVVKVMYAIGCSNAIVQIIMQPIVYKIMKRIGSTKKLVHRSMDFGDIHNWDIVAGICGYAWGMTWLYMAIFVHHPDAYTFFWVTQDILGASMCIVFLGLIQLNSIQVAAILLMVAFFYDIFFVFITPYLFKESIMITVATSGGPPKADPLWCEKYPDDKDCQGGDPLPMLLTMPRLFDYQGGSSLLGLGDIVLPGLLLSFAARLDAAKSLVAIVSGGRESVARGQTCSPNRACCSYSGYYFLPLVAAYAVGLLMANVAVYVMNQGQPALLYLVPCTLGTMSYLGWKRQELRSLWDGPRVLATADQIIYGRPEASSSNSTSANTNDPTAPAPTSEPMAYEETNREEFVDEYGDDETGDVPLLATKNDTDASN